MKAELLTILTSGALAASHTVAKEFHNKENKQRMNKDEPKTRKIKKQKYRSQKEGRRRNRKS